MPVNQTLNYSIYKASDDSGFVIYNKVSGETTFVSSKDELLAVTSFSFEELFTGKTS